MRASTRLRLAACVALLGGWAADAVAAPREAQDVRIGSVRMRPVRQVGCGKPVVPTRLPAARGALDIRVTDDCGAKPGQEAPPVLFIGARGGAEGTGAGAPAHAAAGARQNAKAPQRGKRGKPAPIASNGPPTPADLQEMERLRKELAEKLAPLSAGEPAAAVVLGSPAPRSASTQAARPLSSKPLPSCKPEYDLAAWAGEEKFAERLVALRQAAAHAEDSARSRADLAEFYVAHVMPNEALALAPERSAADLSAPDGVRLARAADMARLLRAEPIDPTSPLLAEHADCEDADAGLWHALAAAASGDAAGAQRNAQAARAALEHVPEPLRSHFARLIAEHAGGDAETQKLMGLAVRNLRAGGIPDDLAGRLILQAGLFHHLGKTTEEREALERAASSETIAGVTAKTRLAVAELDGPEAAHNEAVLRDIARTYRDAKQGEEAAIALARWKFDRRDYAAALDLADESAVAARSAGSPGAKLAAEALRALFADRDDGRDETARLELFWRYQGYATPGTKGDDIRIGAVRALLRQGLPDTALDIARQLSPASVAGAGREALAAAEAAAAEGDPARALALLGAAPTEEGRRIASAALARLGRFAEAAARLDDMPRAEDRSRRASLLFHAADWRQAAEAYADLLRDPELDKDARAEATTRYSLAVAALGRTPDRAPAPELLAASSPARGLLPVDAPAGQRTQVAALRDALDRSKRLEKLLNN